VFGLDKKDLDPAEGKPNYTSFLIDKLNKIYDAWDDNRPEHALGRAIKLWFFLPIELKDKMEDDKNKITKDINAAYRINSVDFFTSHLVRNREARKLAVRYLPIFLDQMMRWLDQRGYLEDRKRKVRTGRE